MDQHWRFQILKRLPNLLAFVFGEDWFLTAADWYVLDREFVQSIIIQLATKRGRNVKFEADSASAKCR